MRQSTLAPSAKWLCHALPLHYPLSAVPGHLTDPPAKHNPTLKVTKLYSLHWQKKCAPESFWQQAGISPWLGRKVLSGVSFDLQEDADDVVPAAGPKYIKEYSQRLAMQSQNLTVKCSCRE